MTTLTVGELEANLREVLERVRAGERVVIESDGAPAVQISPCDPFAALEAAFPGITRATRHSRDIVTTCVPVPPGVDVVAMLIEDRADRL